MTGLLLESRAQRPRRAGGASLSLAIHTAIAGALALGSTTVKRAAAPPVDFPVRLATMLPARASATAPTTTTPASVRLPTTLVAPTIVVPPAAIPAGVPTISVSPGDPLTDFQIGHAPSGDGRIGRAIDVSADDVPAAGEWGGAELLMRIVASRKPRYPESLRQAGIDGRVLVRFTVDTSGAVDMSTVTILSSTHELFTRSVRDVLPAFRFKPAELRGKKVPSLAEMPFEFSIAK